VSDSAAGPWPSAGQVLAQRSGGPAGVALLFTALARRVGLPARPVAGLLLDRRGSKRHTWAEAYIGDWVPVDPAFGQFPASAVHARLAVGATAQWNEYAPVAATLQPSAFLGAQ
jgi:transglutaminase-like putative cysteine protease